MLEFTKFKKIPRLSRTCTITEKLDGANASVMIIHYQDLLTSFVGEDSKSRQEEMNEFVDEYCLYKTLAITDENDILYIFAGSRNRWLNCSKNGDNQGFSKWVKANAEELLKLGEGRHFGEWYGNGIQRKYGLDEKRFALFNVKKWVSRRVFIGNELFKCEKLKEGDKRVFPPRCCEVVPILYEGIFDTVKIAEVLEKLRIDGSSAVPKYFNPEGIVIYHKASGQLFKKTILDDEKPKGQNER